MSRAGDLLYKLRVHLGYRRSRPGFVAKYHMWSADVQRALEDGTTLMKEQHVIDLVKYNVISQDSDYYIAFMEAAVKDEISRTLVVAQKPESDNRISDDGPSLVNQMSEELSLMTNMEADIHRLNVRLKNIEMDILRLTDANSRIAEYLRGKNAIPTESVKTKSP